MNRSYRLVVPILIGCLSLPGCSDDCVFTSTQSVSISPATDCLFASVPPPTSKQSIAGCEAPTLIINNACSEPVVVPGGATADGADYEIDAGSYAEILVRLDLGSAIGPGLTEFIVPAAIGAAAITIGFVLVKEARSSGGRGDDDDDD